MGAAWRRRRAQQAPGRGQRCSARPRGSFLWKRSERTGALPPNPAPRGNPASQVGSHFDPECDLFVPSERRMVLTSDACLVTMAAVLAACTAKLGLAAMFCLYFVPYW